MLLGVSTVCCNLVPSAIAFVMNLFVDGGGQLKLFVYPWRVLLALWSAYNCER